MSFRDLQQRAEGHDLLADSAHLADFWRMRLGALQNEVFEVTYPDSGYRLLRNGVERTEGAAAREATAIYICSRIVLVY